MRTNHIAAVSGSLLAATLLATALNFGPLQRAAKAAVKQGDDRLSVVLFRGELSEAGISLGPWGSGNAEVSKEAVRVGSNSIKVTTQGMYQGARLDFSNGVNLTEAFKNPSAYLRLQVRFTGSGAVQNVLAGGSGSGGPGSYAPPGGGPPGGGPPGDYGPGAAGGGGGIGGVETVRRLASPFKNMRYVMVMGDGSRYELVRPVDVPPTDDPDSYVALSFPLAAITKKLAAGKTLTGPGATLKQLAVFGDKYEQFYIGEINVIADTTEITVAPLEEQIFFANQYTPFVANAEGGTSTLRYSWDFDAKDGIQEDAVGRAVTKVFTRKGGATAEERAAKYTVTLTVSDVDGIKKPVVVTQDIEVND